MRRFLTGFATFPVCIAAGFLVVMLLDDRSRRRWQARIAADARLADLHTEEEIP